MEALRTELRALSLDEIIAFEVAFRRYLNEAYTWDLWGAAYVIHGGCSDDGFEYFRLMGNQIPMRECLRPPRALLHPSCLILAYGGHLNHHRHKQE
jgi:hypothetical protein